MENNEQPQSIPPQPAHKRTMLLAGVLLIVIFIGLALLSQKPQTSLPEPTPTATQPSPTPNVAFTTLSIDPNTISVPNSQAAKTTNANVVINTNQNNITAVEFEIQYDPKVLSNVKVTPGTFFPNPLVLRNTIDTTKGIIHYAIAIQVTGTPQNGTGTVATISFRTTPNTQQQSQLTFTDNTIVAGQEGVNSLLNSSQDAQIIFTQ